MARKSTPIQAAVRRIALLRAVVRAQRQLAEAAPHDARNGRLGLVAPDTPRDRVPAEIAARFDELEGFLNHLGVAHVATLFEEAAKERLKVVIGEVRAAVERMGKSGPRWPAGLVRSPDSFDGLSSLSSVIPFERREKADFGLIRQVRNDFSHAIRTAGTPAITIDEAAAVLTDLLDRIGTRSRDQL